MFEDYACIPLDVPLPPVDMAALREFVHTRCEGCAFSGDDVRLLMYYARKPLIDGEMILYVPDPRFEAPGRDARFGWDPAFGARFPALAAWFEALPFRRLEGVTLVTQTADVAEHMDIFGHNNSISYYERFRALEPRYYRMVFSLPGDETPRTRSLYVTTEYGGEKRFIELPASTRLFAMSSSTCYHGAVFQPGHFKTTGVIYGELDEARHLALLERSLARFPDHALRLERPGPVHGPAAELPYRGV